LSTEDQTSGSDIAPITIEDEMRRSYLDYAMSVIVSRALPDVRDGLKPVHRRILYAMKEGGYDWNRPYRKSARIVGDVMGNYHPHGDSAIYDAMVRMAQPFSLRLMLVDGQGNFGSMDGDPPAAMRYTEARLKHVASQMLDDIGKDTVDFQPNYDEQNKEPVVLPAPFPNLLVNGAGGIAVGMATNIPPHNLGEVIDACKAYVANPDISVDELFEIIPGPDFPTGGLILGRAGSKLAYHTGRGSVVIRARTNIETIRKDREAIIVTEIPYQLNKTRLLERIAEVVRDKIVEGISALRDESDRHGVRVVIEVKRDAQTDVVLNQLFRFTQLQTSFGCNMLAINGGKPELLNLRQIIEAFVNFREEVITRRVIYELNDARKRAHVLVGLAVAVSNIDRVIALIRSAPDPQTAREQLMAIHWPASDIAEYIGLIDDPEYKVAEDGTYQLSEAQARAILDLRLHRLTGLERDKVTDELKELAMQIKDYLDILGSRERVMTILVEELDAIRDAYADDRRTTIEESEADYDVEELIPREDMVVTVSHGGYVKRVPLSTYRAQRRGGKGRSGMSTRDEDFVTQVLVCNTHTPVLFFSSTGIVYKMKVYRLPIGTPQARGKAFVNILPLKPDEKITAFLPLPEDESTADQFDVMFSTASGGVRRNRLSDFVNVWANGKIAMKLDEGDQLVDVHICREDQDVMLATKKGKAIRFQVGDVRVFVGRTSTGVRGISLAAGDEVISMSILNHMNIDTEQRDAYLKHANAMRRAEEEGESGTDVGGGLDPDRIAELGAAEEFVLALADDGIGKRSSSYEYRVSGRGGKGIDNMDLSRSKTGEVKDVIATFPATDNDQIMLVTDQGQLIRCAVNEIGVKGRATKGVRVFNVANDERIVSVAYLADVESDESEDSDGEEGGEATDSSGNSED